MTIQPPSFSKPYRRPMECRYQNRIFTRSNLKKLESLFQPGQEAKKPSSQGIIFIFMFWKPGLMLAVERFSGNRSYSHYYNP
jgi:hypothetical protein